MSQKDELFGILEKGVKDVILDTNTSIGDKLKAIDAGSKLLQIKHKITEPDDKKSNNFFGNK